MGSFQDLVIVMSTYGCYLIFRTIMYRKGIWKRPVQQYNMKYKPNWLQRNLTKVMDKYPFGSLVTFTLIMMAEAYWIYSVI